jgi:DNA-binding protein YbaB
VRFPPAGPGPGNERLRELTEQVTKIAARAREAGEQLNRITVEATSRNRAVTVAVGSGGILRSVRPGPAGNSMTAAQVCTAVMEAYGRASRQAAQEASALMEQVTGRDTETMRRMREAMPAEEGDES